MRALLSLKMLLRVPFKTMLIFLLIAAASFALFSRVVDYAVTARETEHAIMYYRGAAAIDNGVMDTTELNFSRLPNSAMRSSYSRGMATPPEPLTTEQIAALSALPGVSSTDTRYMTAGIIDGLKRAEDYGNYKAKYNYTSRFVIEGTFRGHTIDSSYIPTGSNLLYRNLLNLEDCRLLAGELPITEGDAADIITFAGKGAFIVGMNRIDSFVYENPFSQDFVDTLKEGDRCLIIGRYGLTGDGAMSLFAGDQDTLNYCDSFYLLNDEPENYLETEKFSNVSKIIEITNRDFHTFDMVYTSDMLSIPRFNEKKMVIREGRALKAEDTNACVVNLSFLQLNELKIGDRLTTELCDMLFEQHAGTGAAAVIPERYGKPVKTVELEIVGAYMDTDQESSRNGDEWWGYSPNTIFVPSSLLPVELPADYEVRPGDFSVVIEDARQIETFSAAAKTLAGEMDFQLRFSDGGWLKVKDNLNTGVMMSLITALLFFCAATVALLLVSYLFLWQNKRNYAIMRTLGTPQSKARNALVLPFTVLSALAVPAGGIAGIFYASRASTDALKKLAAANAAYTPDTSLPVGALLLCLLCEAAFLFLFFSLFLRKLSKTPTLVLLQGSGKRTGAKKRDVKTEKAEAVPLMAECRSSQRSPEGVLSTLPLRHGQYHVVCHVTRYIVRHMRRAGLKTSLAVLLAMLLTGAMGTLAVTKLSYQELFGDIEVKGTVNQFTAKSIQKASNSLLTKDFYYQSKLFVFCNGVPYNYTMNLTNDFERCMNDENSEVEYAPGYDASFVSQNKALCVLGGTLADIFGVKPGDSITLLSASWHTYLMVKYGEKLEKYGEEEALLYLNESIAEYSVEFTVAGVITSNSPDDGKYLYASVSAFTEKINGDTSNPIVVEFGEFALADNEKSYELDNYLSTLARESAAYFDGVTYYLDTTELYNVKRVRDMLVLLFPIAVAAAVFIGLTAPLLIILQSSKEAAILRVLGTTKGRARCMLALEQISLCFFGLTLAALGLVLYNKGLFVRSADTLAVCGILYLIGCACAAVFAAAAVTRHRVLQLLQVKE